MYNYIKYYDIGFKNGVIKSIKDNLTNTKRRFKIIKTNRLKSQLYNIGYIDGYYLIKKLSLNIK